MIPQIRSNPSDETKILRCDRVSYVIRWKLELEVKIYEWRSRTKIREGSSYQNRIAGAEGERSRRSRREIHLAFLHAPVPAGHQPGERRDDRRRRRQHLSGFQRRSRSLFDRSFSSARRRSDQETGGRFHSHLRGRLLLPATAGAGRETEQADSGELREEG